ncbi:triose-phosphate isomerase [Candidatus Pacearchaeota archaeon]|nr:triose-phosphate isomerase [Candidatus Pacearchaeota archaeon]MBD3283261.1 triose-phosphate isomerase [Candidatus Pacearchaeota archaeon]
MIIIINLKTYQQGKAVIKLAKKIQKVNNKIIIGAQASDIYELAKQTKLKIFAEHVDPYEPGRYTGFIIPEAVKKDGAIGTFLNHSEHKLDFKTIKKTLKRCKQIKLKTAIFVKNLKEAKKIEKLKPDYLIYEPPELVAGKISVSNAKPEIIEKIAKKLKMKFLVGAGIKTKEDIKTSKKLGASGIAVSSAITKAKDPEKSLKNLIE